MSTELFWLWLIYIFYYTLISLCILKIANCTALSFCLRTYDFRLQLTVIYKEPKTNSFDHRYQKIYSSYKSYEVKKTSAFFIWYLNELAKKFRMFMTLSCRVCWCHNSMLAFTMPCSSEQIVIDGVDMVGMQTSHWYWEPRIVVH